MEAQQTNPANKPIQKTPPDQPFMMRVSGKSDVHKIASAIYHGLREHPSVVLRTLGAGPMQQGMKAVAIVSGRLRTEGFDVFARVSMHDEPQEAGGNLTILSVQVERKPL